MTLEEKAGLMMHPMISAGKEGKLVEMPNMMMPVGTVRDGRQSPYQSF